MAPFKETDNSKPTIVGIASSGHEAEALGQ